MRRRNKEKERAQRRAWYGKNKEKKKADSKRWRQENPDKESARQKERYLQNKDAISEYAREWYRKNAATQQLKHKQWRRDNPGKVRAYSAARRARQRSASCGDAKKITAYSKVLLLQYCAFCGSQSELEIDHIIPLARGGAHDWENLQPLCRSCNASKGAKTMEEWCPTLA